MSCNSRQVGVCLLMVLKPQSLGSSRGMGCFENDCGLYRTLNTGHVLHKTEFVPVMKSVENFEVLLTSCRLMYFVNVSQFMLTCFSFTFIQLCMFSFTNLIFIFILYMNKPVYRLVGMMHSWFVCFR